jgi:23S rRNA (guanosine2251-2'-O)-methyltransferase
MPGRSAAGGGAGRGKGRPAGDRRAPAPAPPGRTPGRRIASGDNRVGRPNREAKGIGGEQVEGRQAVRELLIAGRRRVKDLWISEDVEHADVITEIERLAARAKVPVRYVPRAKLEKEARTDAVQGVLAHAAAIPEADLDELAGADGAFLVLLDGVTDPHNLGAVLRSAEFCGATGAVLPRHRAAHVTPTVAKASAGAVEHVPLAIVPGLPAALLKLRDAGIWRIGLDQDAPRSLDDLGRNLGERPVALVLGAEGTGLSRLTRERCDEVVAIPRSGSVGSLNVAAAAAIALQEVARIRRSAAKVRIAEEGERTK